MPESKSERRYTAFAGPRLMASGPIHEVALAAKRALDSAMDQADGDLMVFDDASGRVLDLDLSGDESDVARRFVGPTAGSSPPSTDPGDAPGRRGPGRPKLGVVSHEVTLLPRHWAWLRAQRGSASATLRRLVDQARQRQGGADRVRRAQDAAYRFMTAVVGDAAGYEEALRALYAGDRERFERESKPWPRDFRRHARLLADPAFRVEDPGEPDPRRGD